MQEHKKVTEVGAYYREQSLHCFGKCWLLPMSDIRLIRNLSMETSLQYFS